MTLGMTLGKDVVNRRTANFAPYPLKTLCLNQRLYRKFHFKYHINKPEKHVQVLIYFLTKYHNRLLVPFHPGSYHLNHKRSGWRHNSSQRMNNSVGKEQGDLSLKSENGIRNFSHGPKSFLPIGRKDSLFVHRISALNRLQGAKFSPYRSKGQFFCPPYICH